MKKITFLLLLMMFVHHVTAQVLNQPAGWPNTDWTITGTYVDTPTAFEADPTLTANFAYDDDDAGSGTINTIAAESPVIDLTDAFNAGETWLVLTSTYVYNNLSNDSISIQYWDADASAWVTWGAPLTTDTPGAPTDNFCSGTSAPFNSGELNIAGFTATQLSGFRYRIFFDDGGGWVWGFCFDSPLLFSQTPPTCPVPTNLAVSNVGGTTATITWTAGSTETAWEYVRQAAGTGEPTGNGTSQTSTTVNETALDYSTAYEVYVRADCGGDGYSLWIGPLNFTTTVQTEFTVDCTAGPTNFNYCYANGGAANPEIFTFTSTDGTSLNLTFNAGTIENGWDELVIIDTDGSYIVAPTDNYYGNAGNLTGLTYQSSGDTISFYINSDGIFSCQDGGFTPIDVSVTCATCTNPTATYSVRGDCAVGPQFYVDVDITSLGSATTLILTDNQGSTPQSVTATGVVSFGPYPNATDVQITVTNDDDQNCVRSSNILTQPFCQDYLVDCAVGPASLEYCYTSGGAADPVIFTFTSTDGTPLNLTFNAGTIEINWDELVIIDTDGSYIVAPTDNYYGNNGDLSGLTYQSSGDTISFYINSDGSISCEQSGTFTPIDVTVACATCINPQATYAVIDDCENGDQFLIDVNITSIGDAQSVTVTDNQESPGVQVSAAGIVQMGPYPFATPIVITISNDLDVNCVINSAPIQVVACPPANDNPCNATIAAVNDNFSCEVTTPGTILAATPSGVPIGSCDGNPDDDVWFQFTALNEVQLISLINITGGTDNLDHALYSGSCGTLVELYCSGNTANITPSLTVGDTYYIRVFSAGSIEETSNFNLCIQEAPSNLVCENATNFCGGDGGLFTTSMIGIPDIGAIACLTGAPNPTWNIIQIGNSGVIDLQIVQNSQFDANGNPVGTPLDVDYALWGPFTSLDDACGNLTLGCPNPSNCPGIPYTPEFYPYENIIDCSWSASATEIATIDNAVAGEVYILLVTNWSGNPGQIRITQTNEGNPDAGSTVAEIQADLGGDQQLCGFTSYELVVDSPFADTYEWYQDGFYIEDATGPTLTVTESGSYTVFVHDDQCDATASDEVTITLVPEPMANAVSDIITCDDASGDEIGEFNLESQTPFVLGAQDPSLFNVTYHLTQVDANTDANPLASPYTNTENPQTIYIRIEAVGGEFCIATTSFQLVISGPTPTVTHVDYSICDDGSNDGVASFDLQSQDLLVLGTQSPADFTVTYHESEAEANAGTGALASPYTNTDNPQTIWVRVESNVSATCFGVGTMTLEVTAAPTANTVPNLGGCDADGDQIPDFDLTIHEADILGGQTGMTVTYHISQGDADAGVGAIGTPDDYSSTIPATIYVRVESAPDCYNVTSFDLVNGEDPVTTLTSGTGRFEICDNAINPLVITAQPSNYAASDVSIVWYQDGGVMDGENGLSISVLTGGLFEIEVTFNATGCTSTIGQEVVQLGNCIIPQGISPDGDGKNDTFDLSNFNVSRIEIFNRYGTLVYSKDNYTNEWYGQSNNGDELPVGTYFYTIVYEGGTKTKSAWVYLNK